VWRAGNSADPKAIAQEYLVRLPRLTESFERDGSQMHKRRRFNYRLVLAGLRI